MLVLISKLRCEAMFKRVLLVLIWFLDLVVDVHTLCDPFYGSGINPQDCKQALQKLWLAQSNTHSDAYESRAFSRYSTNPKVRLPQGYVYNSCAIGIDVAKPIGMRPVEVARGLNWFTVVQTVERVLATCVEGKIGPTGYGGHEDYGELVVVIANPRTLSLQATCLDPLATEQTYIYAPTMSLANTLALRTHLVASRIAKNLWSQGQTVPMPPNPYEFVTRENVLIRVQGPFELRSAGWTPVFPLRTYPWPKSNQWVVLRSLKLSQQRLPGQPGSPMIGTVSVPVSILTNESGGSLVTGVWVSRGNTWVRLHGTVNLTQLLQEADWVLIKTGTDPSKRAGWGDQWLGYWPDLTIRDIGPGSGF